MQTSKPFTFGFDDDDIDSKELEGVPQVAEQSPTQSESQGIVPPQLHSLYDLVWYFEATIPIIIFPSLPCSSISSTWTTTSHTLIHIATLTLPVLNSLMISVISHTRVASSGFLSTNKISQFFSHYAPSPGVKVISLTMSIILAFISSVTTFLQYHCDQI